jgi:hypothetical protein
VTKEGTGSADCADNNHNILIERGGALIERKERKAWMHDNNLPLPQCIHKGIEGVGDANNVK